MPHPCPIQNNQNPALCRPHKKAARLEAEDGQPAGAGGATPAPAASSSSSSSEEVGGGGPAPDPGDKRSRSQRRPQLEHPLPPSSG
jgi:hypothetical protein